MKVASLTVRFLDGFQTTANNFQGRLQDIFASAGFEKLRRTQQFMTILGTLSLFKGNKQN